MRYPNSTKTEFQRSMITYYAEEDAQTSAEFLHLARTASGNQFWRPTYIGLPRKPHGQQEYLKRFPAKPEEVPVVI
ncbi:uncharacterized protein YALI1_D21795g [Yarrowia lipolytica]|uniref:Uncharacterized protein n=1 Tax=Yarrowia lipolytica TaxID=4952 RepID=A0A1D8NEZ5_YARLL|nr:hypothetical protein YALI1_D21795g [Yarrowia lipolytica]